MDNAESHHDVEMPAYRSHKVVRAARIEQIVPLPHGGANMYLDATYPDGAHAYVTINEAWRRKHEPQAGGYFVAYGDNYTSWSPAEAFEKGYMRIAEPDQPTGAAVTPQDVWRAIVSVQFHVFPDTTLTVCCLTLYNGFTVTGESACVDPADFDPIVGKRIARENATSKVWMVLGFRQRERIHNGEATTAPA